MTTNTDIEELDRIMSGIVQAAVDQKWEKHMIPVALIRLAGDLIRRSHNGDDEGRARLLESAVKMLTDQATIESSKEKTLWPTPNESLN